MRIINTYREAVPPSDVLSPEDILRICCKPTPVDECSEVGRLSPYEGADADHRDFDEQAALEQARAENPGKRIIGVRAEGIGARPGQPCGELHEKWIGALNCCDEVEPMTWDSENSVEVLADNTSGWVFVIGGTRPYHWSIRGQGMTFDGWNMRDAETDVPYIRVYAGPYACGFSPIEVTDGCSTTNGGVRSTNGQWVEKYRSAAGAGAVDVLGRPAMECPGVMVPVWDSHAGGYVNIIGKYRVSQTGESQPCYFGVGYWIRTTFADAMTMCNQVGTLGNCTGAIEYPGRLTGQCFSFSTKCTDGCGECTSKSDFDDGSWLSPAVGWHSVIYFDSGSYHGWGQWSYITSTKIEEWVC